MSVAAPSTTAVPRTARRPDLETRLARSSLPAFRDVVAKPTSHGSQVAALDGLRGVALLLVLASHTKGLGLQGHGAVGVWLFFALSAFLLTSIFAAHPERARERQGLLRYARRRFGRILPMYYTAIGASFLYGRWPLDKTLEHLLFLRGDGIYWTLAQEMIFYLLLPVLVVVVDRLLRGSPPRAALLLLALAAASSLWLDTSVLALRGNRTRLPFYAGVFLCGMAFAYLHRWDALSRAVRAPLVQRLLQTLGVVILLVLVSSAPAWQRLVAEAFPSLPTFERGVSWSRPGLFGLLCAALVWITLACGRSALHRVMSCVPLRAVGIVSFSMYLLHVPVRRQLEEAGLAQGSLCFVATTLLTYVLSCATYSLVERPFMRRS